MTARWSLTLMSRTFSCWIESESVKIKSIMVLVIAPPDFEYLVGSLICMLKFKRPHTRLTKKVHILGPTDKKRHR